MGDYSKITIRESDGNIITFENHKSVKSTVRIAREYAEKGYPDRYVIFSDRRLKADTQGKGEVVESEYGMFMSCILRPSFFPSEASLLGAMSATAMAKALEEHTDKHIGLGWVSDVYCDGVKIGSSTIEGKLDNFTSYEYLIVSFSISITPDNFPPKLTDMIKKVFEEDNTSISMIIARNILNKFFKFYANLKNPTKFMDAYQSMFILRGQSIRYAADQKKKSCKVVDVDAKSGALIVEIRGEGTQKVNSPSYVVMPKRIRLKQR